MHRSEMYRVTFGTSKWLCSIWLSKNLLNLTSFRLTRVRSRLQLITLDMVYALVWKLPLQIFGTGYTLSERASLDTFTVGGSILFMSSKFVCNHQQLEQHSIGQVMRSSQSYVSSDQLNSSGIRQSIVNSIGPCVTQPIPESICVNLETINK
jgi:hypothetical protein